MSCDRDTRLCWGGGTGAQQLNGPGVRAHHDVSCITSRAELVMEMWRCSFPFIRVLSCEQCFFSVRAAMQRCNSSLISLQRVR